MCYNLYGDYMKNKVGIIVSIFLVFLFVVFIDYDYSKRNNKVPKLVIKTENHFLGLFYKGKNCDNYVTFAGYKVKNIICNKEIKDSYTNKNNIVIDKEKYNMIKSLFSDKIDEFKTEEDVLNSYYVAKEYNEKAFKVIDGSAFNYKDTTYSLAYLYKWHNEKWVIAETTKYCMTVVDNNARLYEYKDKKCKKEIDLSKSEKFCEIINSSDLYSNFKSICKKD